MLTLDSALTLSGSFDDECEAVMVMSAAPACSSFRGNRCTKRGISRAATL